MTEREVQTIYKRFAAAIREDGAAAEHPESAEMLARFLWLALIGGPRVEEGIWETLRTRPGMSDDDVAGIRHVYTQRMTSTVKSEELEALRDRYGIEEQQPEEIARAQEAILGDLQGQSERRPPKSLFASAVALTGFSSAFYGAAVGAVVASVPGAEIGAMIGSSTLALVGAALGTMYGTSLGARNQVRFGPLLGLGMGAAFGAAVGGFFGAMIPAFVGSLPGMILGAFAGRFTRQRRLPSWAGFGAFFGTCIGAMVLAFWLDREAATRGAAIGLLAGAAAGSLLFLVLLQVLKRLPRQARKGRRA